MHLRVCQAAFRPLSPHVFENFVNSVFGGKMTVVQDLVLPA